MLVIDGHVKGKLTVINYINCAHNNSEILWMDMIGTYDFCVGGTTHN